jgi:hypothetical protein
MSDDIEKDMHNPAAIARKGLTAMYVVYHNPLDCPGKYVMRGRVIGRGADKPTNYVFVGDTIDEVRAYVPEGLVCLRRAPSDHPSVVETWF